MSTVGSWGYEPGEDGVAGGAVLSVHTFHQDLLFRNRLEQFVVLRVVLADSLWRNRFIRESALRNKNG